VTGVWLLSESHLAIHSFPEFRSACLNLFCCRERPSLEGTPARPPRRDAGVCERVAPALSLARRGSRPPLLNLEASERGDEQENGFIWKMNPSNPDLERTLFS
jgi:S-adenosylmethionine decarboxylase